MSTTRSQPYRFARDLGDVEAFEHGYRRAGVAGAPRASWNVRLGESSTAREVVRSTSSSGPSGSDRDA